MQQFNLCDPLQGEGGEQQLFLLYYNCTHVHSKSLEGRSQQSPFDWGKELLVSSIS